MSATIDPPGGVRYAPLSIDTDPPDADGVGATGDGAAVTHVARPEAGSASAPATAPSAQPIAASETAAPGSTDAVLERIAEDLRAGRIDGHAATEQIIVRATADVAPGSSAALRDELRAAVRALVEDDPGLVALCSALARGTPGGGER